MDTSAGASSATPVNGGTRRKKAPRVDEITNLIRSNRDNETVRVTPANAAANANASSTKLVNANASTTANGRSVAKGQKAPVEYDEGIVQVLTLSEMEEEMAKDPPTVASKQHSNASTAGALPSVTKRSNKRNRTELTKLAEWNAHDNTISLSPNRTQEESSRIKRSLQSTTLSNSSSPSASQGKSQSPSHVSPSSADSPTPVDSTMFPGTYGDNNPFDLTYESGSDANVVREYEQTPQFVVRPAPTGLPKEEAISNPFSALAPACVEYDATNTPTLPLSMPNARGYIAYFFWDHYRYAKHAQKIRPPWTYIVQSIPAVFQMTLDILSDIERDTRGLELLRLIDRRWVKSHVVTRDPLQVALEVAKPQTYDNYLAIKQTDKIKLIDGALVEYSINAARRDQLPGVFEGPISLQQKLGLCPLLMDVYLIDKQGKLLVAGGGPVARAQGSTCSCNSHVRNVKITNKLWLPLPSVAVVDRPSTPSGLVNNKAKQRDRTPSVLTQSPGEQILLPLNSSGSSDEKPVTVLDTSETKKSTLSSIHTESTLSGLKLDKNGVEEAPTAKRRRKMKVKEDKVEHAPACNPANDWSDWEEEEIFWIENESPSVAAVLAPANTSTSADINTSSQSGDKVTSSDSMLLSKLKQELATVNLELEAARQELNTVATSAAQWEARYRQEQDKNQHLWARVVLIQRQMHHLSRPVTTLLATQGRLG